MAKATAAQRATQSMRRVLLLVVFTPRKLLLTERVSAAWSITSFSLVLINFPTIHAYCFYQSLKGKHCFSIQAVTGHISLRELLSLKTDLVNHAKKL